MSSPAGLIGVSPTSRDPTTPSCKKRRITPSAELSSPKHTRHIPLPFRLRDQTINILEGEARDLLYGIFPDTLNVTEARCRSHLLFQVRELPKGPWPLTVGGVPLTISDSQGQGRAFLFPRQIMGNMSCSICTDYQGQMDNLTDSFVRRLAAAIASSFKTNAPGTRIREVMFTKENSIYVVLDDSIKINQVRGQLPGRIAGWVVGYLNDRELCRPGWGDGQAQRKIEPQPSRNAVDDTAYDAMRPGVMICSQKQRNHAHPQTLETTSGVLAENDVGARFMTASSHGIGKTATISQGRSQTMVGKAVLEIPFTDVTMIKLEAPIRFENDTFENESGVTTKFLRFVRSNDRIIGEACHLNSPYTGGAEGIVIAKSVKFQSSGDPREDQIRYIVYNWAFMGQEEGNDSAVRPPNGTCGSVIWGKDGIILGFYHDYIDSGIFRGFFSSVSASEVYEAGYFLAN